jgi:hypothetical protein
MIYFTCQRCASARVVIEIDAGVIEPKSIRIPCDAFNSMMLLGFKSLEYSMNFIA